VSLLIPDESLQLGWRPFFPRNSTHFSFLPSLAMDALQAVRHGLTLGELLKGLGIAFALGRLLSPGSESGLNKAGLLSPLHRADVVKTAGFFSLFLAARSWLAFVDRYAPEPYLVSRPPAPFPFPTVPF
jgi:hypothetical protein